MIAVPVGEPVLVHPNVNPSVSKEFKTAAALFPADSSKTMNEADVDNVLGKDVVSCI